MISFFPRGVLDEILNLIESVSEGFPSHFLLQNFSDKDIDIINFVKAFSKFYRRHFDIVSKYNVGLKTLLLQGLSEPEFYGDLVCKFRKITG